MKLLVYSAKKFEIPYLENANNGKYKITFIEDTLTSETAMKAIGFDGISIFSSDDASSLVIEKLKDFKVKFISLRSVGYDNVNLKTATKLKIKDPSPIPDKEMNNGFYFAKDYKFSGYGTFIQFLILYK